MNREIENSTQDKTNPVYLTAKKSVSLMADAGIGDADRIVSKLE